MNSGREKGSGGKRGQKPLFCPQAVADGYSLIALGVDTVFLHEAAARAVRAAREARLPDTGRAR
jgi:hypothetical protein